MTKLNLSELRPALDLEGKYVDFGILRASLTVLTLLEGLEVNLTKPTPEGECRATCPKCQKERSFALNINTNRFNCFNKGCFLKGGGVIDFTAKLFEITAKEASHLVACAYGIQPYSQVKVSRSETPEVADAERVPLAAESPVPDRGGETVSRAEFDALSQRVERLSHIVWSMMFEYGQIDETAPEIFDDVKDHEFETATQG